MTVTSGVVGLDGQQRRCAAIPESVFQVHCRCRALHPALSTSPAMIGPRRRTSPGIVRAAKKKEDIGQKEKDDNCNADDDVSSLEQWVGRCVPRGCAVLLALHWAGVGEGIVVGTISTPVPEQGLARSRPERERDCVHIPATLVGGGEFYLQSHQDKAVVGMRFDVAGVPA